jgi:hypothetical protein
MASAKRRYRNIECGMWDSPDFLSLSAPKKPTAQWLWLYLLTGPCTGIIPGLFRFSIAETAERFGWSAKEISSCLDELVKKNMARFDPATRLIWLPNALKDRNAPASPNVVRSWRAAWIEVPECELKAQAAEIIEATLATFGEGFAKAFREGSAKPSPKGTRKDPPTLPERIPETFPKGSAEPSPIQESGIRKQEAGVSPHARRVVEVVTEEGLAADATALLDAAEKIARKLDSLEPEAMWSDLDAEIAGWVSHVRKQREDARGRGQHWTSERELEELVSKAQTRIRFRPKDAKMERSRRQSGFGQRFRDDDSDYEPRALTAPRIDGVRS